MNCLINLDVGDLEEAVRFYSSVFGLKVGRSFGAFGVDSHRRARAARCLTIDWSDR
jgi:catechol 2,3-dioxygenase-like lactoylglutathione lyase family enzyme